MILTPAARRIVPILVALAMLASPAAAQEKVGINTAVNPSANGTPPGAIVHKLVIGQEVVYNEHIVTGSSGQTEILFLDQSALTVGPNAELNIDEFVYDPRNSTGKLVISVEHGLLRYIGGKLSKNDDGVTIRTPTGNVGIRGGEILLNVGTGGKLDAVLVYGKELKLTGKTGCTQELRRVGYELTTTDPNACTCSTGPATSAMLAQYLTQLDGIAGAHAGATTIPTEQTLAGSPVPATVSGNLPASIQAANQSQGLPPPPQINLANLQTAFQQHNVQGQNAVVTSVAQQPQPQPPSAVSLATTGAAAFISQGDNTGAFYGTLSYPSATMQNGSFLVTVANVVDPNANAINFGQNGPFITTNPQIAAILAGFSGGATISPLTAGETNIPVTLTIAGSYNGPPLPITPTPVSIYTLNLGTVATGTASVSADGQFLTAALTVSQHIDVPRPKSGFFGGGADIFGSTFFLFSGVPTVNMPLVGVGTFSGTAEGGVVTDTSKYLATGGFNETYNFATLSGRLNITNFDDANYTSAIGGSGNLFTGTLAGPAGRTGSVSGGFYGPIAGETGGTFSIAGASGPKYLVGGVFTGHQ